MRYYKIWECVRKVQERRWSQNENCLWRDPRPQKADKMHTNVQKHITSHLQALFEQPLHLRVSHQKYCQQMALTVRYIKQQHASMLAYANNFEQIPAYASIS